MGPRSIINSRLSRGLYRWARGLAAAAPHGSPVPARHPRRPAAPLRRRRALLIRPRTTSTPPAPSTSRGAPDAGPSPPPETAYRKPAITTFRGVRVHVFIQRVRVQGAPVGRGVRSPRRAVVSESTPRSVPCPSRRLHCNVDIRLA